MVETDVMEALSKGFIEAIAHHKGFFNLSGKDYGTDLHICQAIPRARPTPQKGNRWLTTGQQLQIQLKSTKEKNIRIVKNHVHYSLEADNYNDLICRAKETNKSIPLILMLFLFPNDRAQWLTLNSAELIFRRCAYWYEIDPNATEVSTKKTTVKIPISNLIDADIFPKLFAHFK